jgi:hypothetical protein
MGYDNSSIRSYIAIAALEQLSLQPYFSNIYTRDSYGAGTTFCKRFQNIAFLSDSSRVSL